MKLLNYIQTILIGIYRLLQGMYITMLNFIRPKVTEQYPENRGKVFPHERMRGALTMPHNEDNQHKCTACSICMMNCPNGTIQVITKQEVDETTGKEKKVLDRYLYDIGSCTFCAICTLSCPQNAIEWSIDFEHAVFTRAKLNLQLNKEGSSLIKKEKITKE
ncbi:MAG: 4Fe-4S dicluster domain-containing protein [Dysgonamonadaceae bacterium]|jgi:NADH-quinone oxidoreductase subunit I|nr:4Fe-4S dicluster domain-containing protein [Dysgonamonadaceae bacterium]